jgi:hypothetical protein
MEGAEAESSLLRMQMSFMVTVVAKEVSEWITPTSSIAGDVADWLVFCGKNPGTAPNNILAHGLAIGSKASAYSGNWQLSINYNEQSDWAASNVIVWDQVIFFFMLEYIAVLHA